MLALILAVPVGGILLLNNYTSKSFAEPGSQPVRIRIATPPGYKRIIVPDNSFGAWLRNLPLRPGCPKIFDFNGRMVQNQGNHCAVLDINIGSTDLQQCADIVIRLRAEYLFAIGCGNEIQFNFTNGDSAFWRDWRQGIRPVTRGNSTIWHKIAKPDAGYSSFRAYLDTVFMYAGTMSLSRELLPASNPAKPEIGDVYIIGGFPGHAMLVMDVAENNTGERIFLLAQGFMPAQDIHILRSDEDTSPWFRAKAEGNLEIPGLQRMRMTTHLRKWPAFSVHWIFEYTDLKRFRLTTCEKSADNTNGNQ
jgi:hypothetical protein